MLFVPVMGLWTSSIGIIGLVSFKRELFPRKSEHQKTQSSRPSTPRTSFLNEGLRVGWHQLINHMRTLYSLKKFFLEVMHCESLSCFCLRVCFSLIAGGAFALMWSNIRDINKAMSEPPKPRHPEAPAHW